MTSEAAEKPRTAGESCAKHPSAAKADGDFAAFYGTAEAVPFQSSEFSAACSVVPKKCEKKQNPAERQLYALFKKLYVGRYGPAAARLRSKPFTIRY